MSIRIDDLAREVMKGLDEYADVITQRQSYRAEINQLLEEVE